MTPSKRHSIGLCWNCDKLPEIGFSRCQYHRKAANIVMRNKRYSWKKEIYDHYGNRCNCCGETEVHFLSIDHINNDGYKQRAYRNGKRGYWSSYRVYEYIIKNNFPTDLQLLCMNCNYGKKQNKGVCPHQTMVNKSTESTGNGQDNDHTGIPGN